MPDEVEEEIRRNLLLHQKADSVADAMFSRDCVAWGRLKTLVLDAMIDYELDLLKCFKDRLAQKEG